MALVGIVRGLERAVIGKDSAYTPLMKPDGRTLDFTKAQTVNLISEPDLFDRATAALDGDGTFTYQGKLWQVGIGANAERLEIYPTQQQ